MGPLSDTECAYIAGLFDGEGCISIVRIFRKYPGAKKSCEMYILRVQMTNVDPRPIYPLRDRFGGWVYVTKHKNPNQRDTHVWVATSHLALKFLEAIRPWLVCKAEQADIAINLQTSRVYRGKAGTPAEDRQRERQQYTDITALKFRTFNLADYGMVANSGNGRTGRPRAKQGESLGVCNEHVPPSTEKICSGPCGNTGSAAEMIAPGLLAE